MRQKLTPSSPAIHDGLHNLVSYIPDDHMQSLNKRQLGMCNIYALSKSMQTIRS